MTQKRQRGQVAVLFAIVLTVLVGIIALAVDFGFLTDQHRNLQAFADQAAMAGATQLNPAVATSSTPAQQQAARQAAFMNMRDNLTHGAGASAIPLSSLPSCWGPSANRFASDITDCSLPSPYDNYRFNICSPAQADSSGPACRKGLAANTVSVTVNESVLNSLAGLVGQPQSTAGAFSAAEYTESSVGIPGALGGTGGAVGGNGGTAGPGGYGSGGGPGSGNKQPGAPGLPPALSAYASYRLSYALYSGGCVSTGAKTELIGGDVYIDKCGLSLGSGISSSFCAESTFATAGNIIFGPDAVLPTLPVPLAQQSLASCTTVTAGTTLAMGTVDKRTEAIAVPAYPPPPTAAGSAGFVPYKAPSPSTPYSAAVANKACLNGAVDASGAPASACFDPGYYSTIGAGSDEDNTSNTSGSYAIHNNLNPGVYYVTGTEDCYGDSSTTNCPGVTFGGNTMNANWANVAHACWAAPNVPASGAFVGNCPDGFAFDPTSPAVTDPMCSAASQVPLPAPVFATAPSVAVGGGLGSVLGTTYGVRVTALNGFGESTSTEAAVSVVAPNNSITITIAKVPTATNYKVYVNSSNPLPLVGEKLLANVLDSALPTTTYVATAEGNGPGYPRYDTSSCKTGFRNIPTAPNSDQNNGVTFVLLRKAGMCFNPTCRSGAGNPTPTVLLSPFCSTYRKNLRPGSAGVEIPLPPAPPAPNPAITVGTPCPQAYGYPGDGSYIVYGDTTGQIETANAGTQTGLTGTIFAPFAALKASDQTALEIIEGQAILGQVTALDTANPLAPVIYFPCCPAAGGGAPPGPAAGKNLGGQPNNGLPGNPGDNGGSAVGGPPVGQGVPADLLGGVKSAFVRLIR